MLGPWIARLRMVLRRSRLDAEMDEEIRVHLEMATEEYVRQGMSLADARRAARRSFGGVEQIRERHRRERGLSGLEDFVGDVRLATRVLLRERTFTVTAAATLAIGIGANAAIFAVVDAVLLRPLPYPEAQRIATVGLRRATGLRDRARFTAGGYRFVRERNRSFEEIGAFHTAQTPLIGSGDPLQASVTAMTNSALAVLAMSPWLGRLPTNAEDLPGGPRVALLSHRLWSTRFGADPKVLGRTIELNDTTREVIGVMPPEFGFPSRGIDVWIPMQLDPASSDTRASRYYIFGRLRAGATIQSASGDVGRLIARLREVGHAQGLLTTILAGEASAKTVKEELVGESRLLLLVLMGSVSIVLLIALSNTATLFVIRAEDHTHERAVRAALGASRGRLTRYALTEALLLALTGGLAGLFLASIGTRALVAVAPPSVPRLEEVGITPRLVGYATVLTVIASVVFAMLPAWGLRSARRFLPDLSRAGRNATAGPERLRLRGALVAAQVAMAVVLLIGSGLMVRSYAKLRSVDPGFDPANVTTFGLLLPARRYSNAEAAALYQELTERLRSIPGIEAAAVTSGLPVTPSQASYRLAIEDVPDGTDVFVVRWVTPGYFELMGIPLVDGRTMLPDDRSEFRAFISESFAAQYWPGESAVGRHLGPDGSLWADVVGVVGDERIRGLDVPVEGAVYAPIGAPNLPSILSVSVVVRTSMDSANLVPLLRREVGALDSELPLVDIRSMYDVISDSYAVGRTTFATLLFVVSAFVALVLGAVGIYGVIAYSVSRRTSEIGIRIALGATSGNIFTRVASLGLAPAALGVAAGLGIAALGSRGLSSLLFETGPLDLLTYMTGPALLLLVSTAACIAPTQRAIRIDPVRALRTE